MEAFEEPQPTPARGTETDSNSAIRLTNSILGPSQGDIEAATIVALIVWDK